MKITFETMSPAYEVQALTLYNTYILESTATFSIETLKQEEMNYLLYSGLERFPSFAILMDGQFVGYVMLNRYKPREAYDQTAEVTIYVDSAFHGNGIGKKALHYIEDFAKENEFRALLGVICAENIASIELFKKFDYFECAHFREVGRKFNRVLDVVIYEKLI